MLARTDLVEGLGDASNVLVDCPTEHPADGDVCTDLLTVAEPGDEHVVRLAAGATGEWARRWEASVEDPPGALTVLSLEDAASAAAIDATALSEADPTVESLEPTDGLAQLGIRASEHLQRRDDLRPVVCLHSVNDLLATAEERQVFRFLHAFGERIASAGATAHYHLDPDPLDRGTVATLDHLFDATVEVSGGGVAVRTGGDSTVRS